MIARLPSPARRAPLSLGWIVALLLLGAGYRVAAPLLDLPGNTAPLMAIAFGGAMLIGLRFWWVPLLLLLASDLLLGVFLPGGGMGGYTLMSALFYGAVAYVGAKAGRHLRLWPMMWCGTLLCGVLFYGLANTYSWLVLPEYPKSLAGWWQSQTTGLPQFSPPAWVFLRNSLIADSIWCGFAGLVYTAFRQSIPQTIATAEAKG